MVYFRENPKLNSWMTGEIPIYGTPPDDDPRSYTKILLIFFEELLAPVVNGQAGEAEVAADIVALPELERLRVACFIQIWDLVYTCFQFFLFLDDFLATFG